MATRSLIACRATPLMRVSALLICAGMFAPIATLRGQAQTIDTLISATDELAAAVHPRTGALLVVVSGAPLARVFVSTNGQWRASRMPASLAPPAPDGAQLATGRLAAAFDADGRVHVLAELRRRAPASVGRPNASRVDLYYTSSADLGVTWSPLVMIDSAGTGLFPRVAVVGDAVLASWGYRANYRLNVARGDNRGHRWTAIADVPDDCINVSEVAAFRDTLYVACAGYAGDSVLMAGRNPFTGVRIYRVDPDRVTLQATMTGLNGVWPRLVATRDHLVLSANVFRVHAGRGKGWDKCCAAMSRSTDARAWSAPMDVRASLHGDDAWDTFQLRETYVDRHGLLHSIADGSDQADPANGAPGTGARLIHATFDPRSWKLVTEVPITDPVDAPQGYYPGNATMALGRDSAAVIWTMGTRLMYTGLPARAR